MYVYRSADCWPTGTAPKSRPLGDTRKRGGTPTPAIVTECCCPFSVNTDVADVGPSAVGSNITSSVHAEPGARLTSLQPERTVNGGSTAPPAIPTKTVVALTLRMFTN